jgi:hypothetical protein
MRYKLKLPKQYNINNKGFVELELRTVEKQAL